MLKELLWAKITLTPPSPYCHWWRPWTKLYRMFNGWQWVFGPLTITGEITKKTITVHYWKAIGYHGCGTLRSPEPMNETEALNWVSVFGNVAYVDRECGFIFYRPKE